MSSNSIIPIKIRNTGEGYTTHESTNIEARHQTIKRPNTNTECKGKKVISPYLTEETLKAMDTDSSINQNWNILKHAKIHKSRKREANESRNKSINNIKSTFNTRTINV